MRLFRISVADFRPPETLRRQREQPLAVLVEVNQRKGGQQPFMILLQSAIAQFGISENALQNAEGPLHLGTYSCLGTILAPLPLVYRVLALRASRGHVLRFGGSGMNRLCLALVACVAPDLLLCTVQQIGQHMYIRYRGSRGAHRMHDAFFTIHADVRLGTEMPLVPLLGLMHLRIALALAVLGRRRSRDDRRIDDGAGGDAQAFARKVMVYRVQHLAA